MQLEIGAHTTHIARMFRAMSWRAVSTSIFSKCCRAMPCHSLLFACRVIPCQISAKLFRGGPCHVSGSDVETVSSCDKSCQTMSKRVRTRAELCQHILAWFYGSSNRVWHDSPKAFVDTVMHEIILQNHYPTPRHGTKHPQ